MVLHKSSTLTIKGSKLKSGNENLSEKHDFFQYCFAKPCSAAPQAAVRITGLSVSGFSSQKALKRGKNEPVFDKHINSGSFFNDIQFWILDSRYSILVEYQASRLVGCATCCAREFVPRVQKRNLPTLPGPR